MGLITLYHSILGALVADPFLQHIVCFSFFFSFFFTPLEYERCLEAGYEYRESEREGPSDVLVKISPAPAHEEPHLGRAMRIDEAEIRSTQDNYSLKIELKCGFEAYKETLGLLGLDMMLEK